MEIVKKVIDKAKEIILSDAVKRAVIRGVRVLVFGALVAVLTQVAKLPELQAVVGTAFGTALIAMVDKFLRDQMTK